MWRWKQWLAALVLATSLTPLEADTPSQECGGSLYLWHVCLEAYTRPCLACPDIYCAKPYPPVAVCFRPCGCDAYVSKPCPNVGPFFRPCGCDPYQKKPRPPAPAPCLPPWFGCWK